MAKERRKLYRRGREPTKPPVYCKAGYVLRQREWAERGGDACKVCVDECELKKRKA